MYGGSESGADESERTAFRKAEKKYKLYYDDYNKKRGKKKKKHPRAVDLTEVIDFNPILESSLHSNGNGNGNGNGGVSLLARHLDRPVFCLDKRPAASSFSSVGFYFIPGALTIEEQCHWIRESLTAFPQPPNRTNHNAIFGPIHDLFLAANQSKELTHASSTPPLSCKSTPASDLLRKLRWTTLGLQFDWSKRSYNLTLPHNKIPDPLCQLAKKMAAPAMPLNEEFKPEAAIVNYFGSGDMLGGHLDDMEADWSKPIVSMSLGCKAIFLLGGKSREDEPLAMFLRSGDVVLMAGKARECFHGVPRIFTDKDNAEISHLELQLSHEDDLDYLEYIKSSRININIRQVF